jgi:hypothetical protein
VCGVALEATGPIFKTGPVEAKLQDLPNSNHAMEGSSTAATLGEGGIANGNRVATWAPTPGAMTVLTTRGGRTPGRY